MNLKTMIWALTLSAVVIPSYASEDNFTLDKLIRLAISQDQGVAKLSAQAHSLRETGIASATLSDPKLKFGIGGLPVDSFRLDEDAMTNLSVGLAQQFSRGDTLALSQKRYNQQAKIVGYQMDQRRLEIAKSITHLWIELQYLVRIHQLTQEMQQLMKEMSGFTKTNYSLGKNEAQDLLYAELQVSRSDEQLQKNQQMQQRIRAQLSEWVAPGDIERLRTPPISTLSWNTLAATENQLQPHSSAFYSLLSSHPKILAADQNIRVRQTGAEIAAQAFAPQFGIEVGYAYRQANGMNRQPASDLVSAYLTMDIPLFTDKRQDRTYAAARYQTGAAKSQKDLLLIQMNARVRSLLSDRQNLKERIQRYQTVLLKQAKARTQATERGYENNTVQFSELIMAAREELMMATEEARLIADLNNTQNELAYLLNRYDQNITRSDTLSAQEDQK